MEKKNVKRSEKVCRTNRQKYKQINIQTFQLIERIGSESRFVEKTSVYMIRHVRGPQDCLIKTSLLRRLQAQTLPEAPPVGKIHQFSKIAVTVEPIQ